MVDDFRDNLDFFHSQHLRCRHKIYETERLFSRIPDDTRIPTAEVQIAYNSFSRVLDGVTALIDSMDPDSLVFDHDRLRYVSHQAAGFNDIVQKVSTNQIAYDASSSNKEGFNVSDIGDEIKNSFNKVKDVFEDLFKKIENAFKKLGDKLEAIGDKIQNFVGKVTDEIKDGFREFWSLMKPILEAIWGFIQFCYNLAKSIALFTVWWVTKFMKNLVQVPLIGAALAIGLYYASKAFIIYMTGTPDETIGALVIAIFVTVQAIVYQVDLLLDLQDTLVEGVLYFFINPFSSLLTGVGKDDIIHTKFEEFKTSGDIQRRKKLLWGVLQELIKCIFKNPLPWLAYFVIASVVGKFLILDIPVRSFRLVMKDITGFGVLIHV